MEALMEQKEPFWVGTLFGSLMMLLTVLAYDRMTKAPEVTMSSMPSDIVSAYRMGLKDALKTNPASGDLENACLNLWTERQFKKD